MNKKLLKIFGIILGALTIALAVSVFLDGVGYYEGNISYGGDVYDAIQNAAAQAANNVKYVGEMIRFALGSQLMVMGLAMLLGSLCIRVEEPTEDKTEEKPDEEAEAKTEDKVEEKVEERLEEQVEEQPEEQVEETVEEMVEEETEDQSEEETAEPQPAEAEDAAACEEPEATETVTWECTGCGTVHEEEGRFCHVCGKAREEA